MSFAKKAVMCVFFLVLPALLSACGENVGEREMKKKMFKDAEEKAKRYQEWQKSGKKGPPPVAPPSKQ